MPRSQATARSTAAAATISCLLALGALAVAPPASAGCLECDFIYATGCNFELWKIDPTTLTSTLLGNTPEFMFDIAATADGRLFGLGVSGMLWELDPCTGAASPTSGAPGGNGLAGDPTLPVLYAQGPPLTRTDTATFTTSVIGGMIGSGPTDWCGLSTGDLAFQPGTGTLFSTLGCTGLGCPGDTLAHIDPVSGDMTAVAGCTRDATGNGFPDVYGLAFDSNGILWGALGAVVGPELLQITPFGGISITVPVTGGYVCGTGLAILPCDSVTAARCEPHTQGFWKRQCAADHPSGEPVKLDGYAGCVATAVTFATVADRAGICDRLHPAPAQDKCEQAEAQLMAARLNECSGRLDPGCCIRSAHTSATTAGDAFAEADALLANPGRTTADCGRAQAIAAELNEGGALCPVTLDRVRGAGSLAIAPGAEATSGD